MTVRNRTVSIAAAAALGVAAIVSTATGIRAAGIKQSSSTSGTSMWRVTTTTELKGIKRLVVTVDDAGSNAGKCAWSKDDLQRAAAKPLADGSIEVVQYNTSTADAGVATLTIDGVARALSDTLCVGYLSLDVTDFATPVVPSYAQEANAFVSEGRPAGPYALIQGDPAGAPVRSVHMTLGDVRLLGKGGLLTGSPQAFAQAVQEQVARIVTTFVSQIKAANQL